jgi:thiol-disulfide isomerase/thioredoxin
MTDEQTLMTCPRCGHSQRPAPECSRCGVVVSKARSAPVPPVFVRPGAAASETEIPRSPSGLALPIVAALALLGGGIYVKSRGGEPAVPRARTESASASARADSPAAAPARQALAVEPSSRRELEAVPSDRAGRAITLRASDAPSVSDAYAASSSTSRASVSSSWYQGAVGFESADSQRKRLGVPMAVYFYTDWCGYCRRMERDIFGASEVEAHLATLPRVRINPEHGEAERLLAKRFGVGGYPTFLIVSADGGSARRVHPFLTSGTMSPEDFLAALREAE